MRYSGQGRFHRVLSDPPQLAHDLVGARRAVRGVLLEQAEHERVEATRHLGVVPRRGDGCGVEVLRDDADRVVAEERRRAGEQLVEHRAERVEVGAGVGRATRRLFRSEVRDGADDHALDRETRLVDVDGQPEVAELRGTARGEPDVGRLEVAVHDAERVRVRQGERELFADAHRIVDRESVRRLGSESLGERPARHVLRDDVRFTFVVAHVEDGDDVRVIAEARHRPGLAVDAVPAGLVEPVGLHDRDGHLAAEPLVTREVHALAGALAEQALYEVAPTAQRRRQLGRLGGGAEPCAALLAEPSTVAVLVSARCALHGRIVGRPALGFAGLLNPRRWW